MITFRLRNNRVRRIDVYSRTNKRLLMKITVRRDQVILRNCRIYRDSLCKVNLDRSIPVLIFNYGTITVVAYSPEMVKIELERFRQINARVNCILDISADFIRLYNRRYNDL